MENNITRIVDLPDGNMPSGGYNQSMNVSRPTALMDNTQGNYIPINVHPNPYGISGQNPIMNPPQQTTVPNNQVYMSEEDQYQMHQMKQQRLPSRDIPRDSTNYTQDEQVQPNYIPMPKHHDDYVRSHEDMTEKNLKEYEEKKRKERRIDIILTELQTPLVIMLLFFFFQLPMINTMIFKRFSFLSIYNADGNFNFNGLIFKSILFGSAYYSLIKVTNFLSEV